MILSCDGRQDNGFSFCTGTQNIILDFEKIIHTNNYEDLIKYLDSTSKLFEGICFNGNIIINTIYKIFELEYINEIFYKQIINYFQWHRQCGICLRLESKN